MWTKLKSLVTKVGVPAGAAAIVSAGIIIRFGPTLIVKVGKFFSENMSKQNEATLESIPLVGQGFADLKILADTIAPLDKE